MSTFLLEDGLGLHMTEDKPVKKLLLSFQQKMLRARIRRVDREIQKIPWSHKY